MDKKKYNVEIIPCMRGIDSINLRKSLTRGDRLRLQTVYHQNGQNLKRSKS